MKIGIVGAGASGLMAAITAAAGGAHVTLIEKKDRVGKKILATGNGKCNFTNKTIRESDYNSQREGIFGDYISQFDEKAVISLFQQWGMLHKDRDGYCYPRSEQATTVLDILRQQCFVNHVSILTEVSSLDIFKVKKGFEVSFRDGERLQFDRLILACGSPAGERKREDFSGYTYAAKLGHSIVPVVPALVQVKAGGAEFKRIAGVRCEALVLLYIDGSFVAAESGELQLNDYGISGIPVFQLSRHVSYGSYYRKRMEAVIDFLPEYSPKQWNEILRRKWESISKELSLEEFFHGFLNKKLNHMFIIQQGYSLSSKLSALSFEDIKKIASLMKAWKIILKDTMPFENAQVCAGGVSMDEISLTMESKIVPGLFFCGEILDVDGRCGGYNLQWAWTSGYLAGKYAAEKQ